MTFKERMSNAPTFDKLDRASDFIGTTASWVMAFKTQKQQSKIAANIANDIKSINNLANYKAQIIQTLSANLTHIQDNHKLLYKLDLWTQAAVHQTTGFRLAQKVLKYSPQALLKWSEQRLNVAINKAKPHSSLLPAAINSQAISNNASQLKTPIAIDLISSHGVDSQALMNPRTTNCVAALLVNKDVSMIDDKYSDFAKHIDELQTVLEKSYSSNIDKELLKESEDIEHLNKQIHDVNPDYMTFLPSYFWYWYFGIGWVYFSAFWLGNFFLQDVGEVVFVDGGFGVFDTILTLFWIIVFGTPLILLLFQLLKKHPYRTQYYFLKKEQKVAYYFRPALQFFKPYELKIVDYKDIIPEVHTLKHNTAYKPLNLYVADPKTGNITHHIKPHDTHVDARVHWAFIRTYMESDAKELPIDPKLCQAYPEDTSKSLFACADIIYRKTGVLPSNHSGGDQIIVFIIGSLIALGNLLQANNYQCTKQAILHPEVRKLLTWDGKDNPYPIQPEAKLAFEGRNWEVNVRWVCIILINASLFAWAVMAYNN